MCRARHDTWHPHRSQTIVHKPRSTVFWSPINSKWPENNRLRLRGIFSFMGAWFSKMYVIAHQHRGAATAGIVCFTIAFIVQKYISRSSCPCPISSNDELKNAIVLVKKFCVGVWKYCFFLRCRCSLYISFGSTAYTVQEVGPHFFCELLLTSTFHTRIIVLQCTTGSST